MQDLGSLASSPLTPVSEHIHADSSTHDRSPVVVPDTDSSRASSTLAGSQLPAAEITQPAKRPAPDSDPPQNDPAAKRLRPSGGASTHVPRDPVAPASLRDAITEALSQPARALPNPAPHAPPPLPRGLARMHRNPAGPTSTSAPAPAPPPPPPPPSVHAGCARHPSFYYADGNFIMRVEDTLFRLHRTRFAPLSPVLAGRFRDSAYNADPANTLDGCPVYPIPDVRECDMTVLVTRLEQVAL